MRQTKAVILIGILLITTTSGGCVMIVESPELSVSPVQQLSPTTSAGITTQKPTATSTLPRMPTHTTTMTSTMPIAPTLPTEEANIRLHELLSNNGNCRLPCLWGITPGVSTDQNALDTFAPLRSISVYWNYSSYSNYYIGDLEIHYPVDNINYYYYRVSFVSERNIIASVGFEALVIKEDNGDFGPFSIYNSQEFGETTRLFSLANILSEYGVPDSIYLSTIIDPAPAPLDYSTPFEWILLYPDQGIFVKYTMKMQLDGEHVIGCPANAAIDLNVNLRGERKLSPNGIPPTWARNFPPYKSIDEVANMSNEQFHQIFSKAPDQCLVTLTNEWPVP
jgi:hypothetical protein